MASGSVSKDCLKMCNVQLDSAAVKVKANKEGFSEEILKKWKDKIVELAREAALVKHRSEKTTEVIASILGEKRRLEDGASEAKLKQEIIQRIQERASTFDEKKDPFAKKICDYFKTSSENDDFELIEEAFKQSDTICPYTKMTFVNPMKRLIVCGVASVVD